MSRLLDRYGRWAARRPWYAVLAFLLLAVGLNAAGAAWGAAPHDEYEVPGLRAVDGLEVLRAHDPLTANAGARVVLHDESAIAPDTLARLADGLDDVPHVVAVLPPRVDPTGRTAVLTLRYDGLVTDPGIFRAVEPLEDAVQPFRADGLSVELGGEVPESAAQQMSGIGEVVGVGAALLILVLAFGSVVAAGLPVAVALSGLVAGSGGIALLAAVTDVSTIAPTVASLVGLGVGIDYALLVVVRHVDLLRQGHDPVTAAGRALATAGRSVVTAAGTVLVSLLGLRLAGITMFDSFGFATAITVVLIAAACLTLVPALSGLAGDRLRPRSERLGTRAVVHTTATTGRTPWTTRWALAVARRPVAFMLPALALMVALAAPVVTMRMWPQDAGSNPAGSTTRVAHDLVGDAFGPGANAPLYIVVDRTAPGWTPARDAEVTRVLAAEPRLAGASPAAPSPDGAVTTILAEPRFAADDERSPALVDDLRAALPAGVHLTGATPMFHDLDTRLAARLPWVVVFVVAVSMLFLVAAFRSVVVAVKAALLNLLSASAAYGVLTGVFQHGWGSSLLGVDHAVPVSSWVPVLLFAILFGLSMDYEVFLLSRIREDRLATGDDRGSVVRGLASTTRVISAGAGIMVVVALGFALEPDVVVKQMGVGLAAAVLLDATIVRLVLVPATMTLLGRYAWWLPAWLDRVLPQVAAESDAVPAVEAERAPELVGAER